MIDFNKTDLKTDGKNCLSKIIKYQNKEKTVQVS